MFNLLQKLTNAKFVSLTVAACGMFSAMADTPMSSPTLVQVTQSAYRSVDNRLRDQYRHPVETLQFFGLTPQMKVLEIWPARGWYTEILAPFLKDQGQLTLATFRQNHGQLEDERKIFWAKLSAQLDKDIRENPQHFGDVSQFEFDPPALMLGQVSQYDMVLSFRNSHIWDQDGYLIDVYRSFFDALKPGGVLGIVEHRASSVSATTSKALEGYLDESYVIAVAKQAGFVLLDSSQINANPRDSKNYPKGVYALPPTLAMGLKDRAKYLAIGESDRMTLKFIKPQVSTPAVTE